MAASKDFSMLLYPYLRKVFTERYKAKPLDVDRFYKRSKTDRMYETGVGVTGFGLVPATREGMAPIYDDPLQGFPYVHAWLEYRLGFRVTNRLYKNDRYKIFGDKMAKELARSARYTQDLLAARPFLDAWTTFKSPDGMPFYHTAHPLVGGGTLANTSSTPTAPSQTAIQNAFIQMQKQCDDRGKLLDLVAETIIAPPELEFNLSILNNTSYVVGSANNDINPIKGKFNVDIWRHLSGSLNWHVRAAREDTDEVIRWWDREGIETSKYFDWETRSMKFDVGFECGTGAEDFRGYWGYLGV